MNKVIYICLTTSNKILVSYDPGDKPFMCIASRYTKGRTNTADAIRYARETSFTPQNGMRSNAVHIAIIVTDGKMMTINVLH